MGGGGGGQRERESAHKVCAKAVSSGSYVTQQHYHDDHANSPSLSTVLQSMGPSIQNALTFNSLHVPSSSRSLAAYFDPVPIQLGARECSACALDCSARL